MEDNDLNLSAAEAQEEAQIAQQLAEINQSKGLAVTPVTPAESETVEPASQEVSTEDTSSQVSAQEDKSKGSEGQQESEYDFRAPIRGKFESDESYQVRFEIAQKIQERNNAKSQADYNKIQEEIKSLRSELSSIGLNEKITRSHNNHTVGASPESNDSLAQVHDLIRKEFETREISSTLNNFVAKHKELQDEVTRDVFFDFVENNFNYQGKTGQDLARVLELARSAMFRKSESIQDRVLKSANVQEKVNAMQFPGGTVTRQGMSPELQKAHEELKGQGLSEEQISVLLSD